MSKTVTITRRTMLRGMGAAIALPWLEVMGATAAKASAGTNRSSLRMVFMYHPLGAETTAWKGVTGEGRQMRLTPTLRPLERFKEQLLVLDGLNGRRHPPSGHNRSACLWLSSCPPNRRDMWGAESGVTLDQVIAPRLSQGVRQRSLELSCTTVGNLMHAMNLSWRAAGVPMGAETRPRDVFALMFGDPRRDRQRQSILDVVGDDARQLRTRLGQGDLRRLDEYLESVRSLEQRVATSRPVTNRPPPITVPDRPPQSVREHIRLMMDLLVVALQTGFTRVATCAMGDESEGAVGTTYHRGLADLGIDRTTLAGRVDARYLDWGHHKCTHDPRPTLPIIQAIDHWYVEQFAYFLGRMQAVTEGGNSLLDNSIVVYGCANGGGQGRGWPGHGLHDVACLLAGRGGGLLRRPGRHLNFNGNSTQTYRRGVPLSNLWLTLAQMVGVEQREFGLSTGTLAGLG